MIIISLWIALLAVISLSATAWLTGRARDYAIARSMIDVAGPRASHVVPTPRGGGVSIVAVGLLSIAIACFGFAAPMPVPIALIGGGAAIALVGWLDDHGHVPAGARLCVHLAGAGWAVMWLGAFPFQEVMGMARPVGWIDVLVSVILVGWSVNLFNFMDGIDGIAASQAMTVFGGTAILVFAGFGMVPWLISLLLALFASTLAFLAFWNWPPAKIFMGDACSGFLGFLIGALVLVTKQFTSELGIAVIVLAGVFFVDATVTLMMRLVRGKSLSLAHRSHAYQRLSRSAGRHLPVTLGSIVIGWSWLFAWGYVIAAGEIGPITGAMVALMPLVVVAILVGSGRDDE